MKGISNGLSNIIYPAHSMNTTFYALSPDGNLVMFFTNEDGVCPYGFPSGDDDGNEGLKRVFKSVVIECIDEKDVAAEIKRYADRYCKSADEIIDKYSNVVLVRFSYIYETKRLDYSDAETIEGILKGYMDVCGNINRYVLNLQLLPKRNDKLCSVLKQHFGKCIPVVSVDKQIVFQQGMKYNRNVDIYYIEILTEFLLGYKDFWQKLKDEFSGVTLDKASFGFIDTRKIPPEVIETCLITEPGAQVLKKRGLLCFTMYELYKNSESDVKVLRILTESGRIASKVKDAIILIDDSDEFTEFCREFYEMNCKTNCR